MEKYSYVINDSFLKNSSEVDANEINYYTNLLNEKKFRTDLGMGIIEHYYAPKDTKNPQIGERCFYTNENAKIIDNIRRTIDLEIPEKYKNIFISILLYEASVHNNTAGVFKGFYKGLGSPKGKFGGEGENALIRILGEITMEPIILSNFNCERIIYQKNTNELVKNLEEVDLAYYDPPYNPHPYGSNYHMLNTIVDYVDPEELSEVPVFLKNGINLHITEKKRLSMLSMICFKIQKAKYIMISYNNEGFITRQEMVKICKRKGKLHCDHKKYPTFRGSRNFKKRKNKVNESIFLIKSKYVKDNKKYSPNFIKPRKRIKI